MPTLRAMSKSPKQVALRALEAARQSLPAYSATHGPKKFTQHQHFAIAALKQWCGWLARSGFFLSEVAQPSTRRAWRAVTQPVLRLAARRTSHVLDVPEAHRRNKRTLGSALRARTWPMQQWECSLRVLTHNLLAAV
jgi:hypothetical protein